MRIKNDASSDSFMVVTNGARSQGKYPLLLPPKQRQLDSSSAMAQAKRVQEVADHQKQLTADNIDRFDHDRNLNDDPIRSAVDNDREGSDAEVSHF